MKAGLVIKRDKYYVVISYKDEYDIPVKKWFATGLDAKGNKRNAEEMMSNILVNFEKNQSGTTANTKAEKSILFANYLEDWLERSKQNLQVSSYSTYKQQIAKITKYFRDRRITLKKLTPLNIADFYKYLQDEGKSVQTCEHYHVNIRKSLQNALKAGLIEFNPADRIDRPRSPKHTAQFYTKAQLDKLFAVLKDDRFGYIYKITAFYGLRRSEMCGLLWKNIDFENNVVVLNHTVVQTRLNGKSIIIKKDRMKNQSSLRSLPLLPEVKELLLEQQAKQNHNKEMYGNSYETKYADYLCVDDLGYLMNPDTVSAHFKLVLKQNNLPRIKFHELRHSCASILLEYGVGMKEIQEWLGHSTYNTTADIYSHLNYSSKLNVANIIGDAFDENGKKKREEEHIKEKLSQKGYDNFDEPKPSHIQGYSHRERTATKEYDLDSTPNDFGKENESGKKKEIESEKVTEKNNPDNQFQEEQNQNDEIDDEIAELEKLLAEKRKLKKQYDSEM